MSGFEIGQTVRYSRTGTVGKIVSFSEIDGFTFAEVDTTGLLYRVDQLIEISEEIRAASAEVDVKKQIIDEREKLREMQESAWLNVDQSCEGGG
ncbi:MAG: DUF2098 domain-containing protein [Methanocorpusculum sp.]|nr:DUF2098 domain-containing protein [Methanocorpusculum sp.]